MPSYTMQTTGSATIAGRRRYWLPGQTLSGEAADFARLVASGAAIEADAPKAAEVVETAEAPAAPEAAVKPAPKRRRS